MISSRKPLGSQMTLALRTDSMEATVALLQGGRVLETHTWPAGRQLSAELLPAVKDLLERRGQTWQDLSGIIVFQGPGSFTGLRIGITVANTLAYGLGVAIAGAAGDDWIEQGLAGLKEARPGRFVTPNYGAEPNITRPES